MSLPGVKSPDCCPHKKGAETSLPEPNAKTVKEESLDFKGGISDIGTAPTSRVFTRDYKKDGRTVGDTDYVTAALGNPLRL